jgi:midasin
VLEATKISQFRGDYKSGKRLNMKKIIQFIASNFRKDKIWLRRTEPAKRDYQIMIAIDNSLSMKENQFGYFAIKSSITLALALAKAEVGQIGIAKIERGVKMYSIYIIGCITSKRPSALRKARFC